MAARTGLPAKRENQPFLLWGKILKTIVFSLGAGFQLVGRPVLYFLIYFLRFIILFFSLVGNLTIRLIKPVFLILRKSAWLVSKISQWFAGLRLPRLQPLKGPTFSLKLPRLKIVLPRIRKRYLFPFLSLYLVFCSLYLFYFFLLKDLPQPDRLITREQIVSTKIYDRQGRLLYKIYRNENRTLVKLKDIPLSLQQATIAIEDGEFYSHPGFDLKGIVRAAFNNLFRGKMEGGSTITQQLVKAALLTPEKTWARKIKEVILALRVETYFTKEEILQMYFNEVGYGGAAYGVQEASQFYFGEPVGELNLAQSALLAGLPKSPTKYSPFGAYPQLAKKRQKEVLRRMVEEGFISEKEREEAENEELVFKKPGNKIEAPHFVMYVKELLVEKFGEEMVEKGGLEVFTSLDLEIQALAEKVIKQELEKLKPLHVTNAAVLVTRPQSGEILAMVGSRDYFDLENDGNVNVTLMPRQPGSSIKVVNYSYALANGYTPATILSDTAITYKTPGQPPYSPRNYDGKFHGNIPLRQALASSYNVPAVKVLASYGVNKMIDQGEKMGITTWQDRSRFGLSLTLGGGEVKMIDLAVVYGTLANSGRRVDLNPFLKVTDYRGKTLENNFYSQQVLDPKIAYQINDILADNWARTPAFGANSLLNLPEHQVAVKTGTTQNLRDNWTIGYAPAFLVSVWVGNNDNTPMSWVASGVTGATPIWQQIMETILKNESKQSFTPPKDLLAIDICGLNGLLPCQGCPTRTEYFLPGTEPKFHCDPEKINKPAEKPVDKILEGISVEKPVLERSN